MREARPVSEPGRHDFTVATSNDVYVGRIMGLRIDDVRMPGGTTSGREIVEHLGAVAVVAVDDDGHVTLVHQYRHPLRRRLLELPAGLLDVAGEHPADTARRELLEEAGVLAKRWDVLVDVAASPGITDEVVRVFLARDLTAHPREVVEDNEEADLVVRTVPLADAVRMALAGDLVNGPAVSGVLAAHAVLSGTATPRPADADWPDRPTSFAARVRPT